MFVKNKNLYRDTEISGKKGTFWQKLKFRSQIQISIKS